MARAVSIWRLSDGRAGHDNQSLGLVEALARQYPVDCVTIAAKSAWQGVRQVIAGSERHVPPALIVGAGHATHAGLIAGAWRHRARSIVLMRPSLPYAMFDICIVPEHDRVRPRGNIIESIGALNRISPSTQRDAQSALILLGGPSRHHAWEDQTVLEQIRKLLGAKIPLHWQLASSPRTPQRTLHALNECKNLQIVRFQDTSADWLPRQLAHSSLVWVSEDSMSMAYEALSSGALTGLLQVSPMRRSPPTHARGADRLVAAVAALRASGRVVSVEQWLRSPGMRAHAEPLREADRCAAKILERWPNLQ